MKIKKSDQNIIKATLEDFIENNNELIKDHISHLRYINIISPINIEKRFCFDVFKAYANTFQFNKIKYDLFYDNVYKYANDENIYTCLKSILNSKSRLR